MYLPPLVAVAVVAAAVVEVVRRRPSKSDSPVRSMYLVSGAAVHPSVHSLCPAATPCVFRSRDSRRH